MIIFTWDVLQPYGSVAFVPVYENLASSLSNLLAAPPRLFTFYPESHSYLIWTGAPVVNSLTVLYFPADMAERTRGEVRKLSRYESYMIQPADYIYRFGCLQWHRGWVKGEKLLESPRVRNIKGVEDHAGEKTSTMTRAWLNFGAWNEAGKWESWEASEDGRKLQRAWEYKGALGRGTWTAIPEDVSPPPEAAQLPPESHESRERRRKLCEESMLQSASQGSSGRKMQALNEYHAMQKPGDIPDEWLFGKQPSE